MKAILLICLIASLNCNLVDTALCLFTNDKVISIASDILAALKENNFTKIIEIALSKFNDVKLIVQNCLNEEPVLSLKTANYPNPRKVCDPRIRYRACLAFCYNQQNINRSDCLKRCKYGC